MGENRGTKSNFENNFRLYDTFCVQTTLHSTARKLRKICDKTLENNVQRAQKASIPRRSREVSVKNRFPVANVSNSKNKWKTEANFRPSPTKLLSKPTKISLDKPDSGPRFSPTRRFLRKARHKSSLFSCPNKREPPKISCVRLCKRTVPDDVPSLRPIERTVSFLLRQQMGSRISEDKGTKSSSLPRRFPYSTSRPECTKKSYGLCSGAPTESRLVCEFGKVCSKCHKIHRISRDCVEYKKEREETAGTENNSIIDRFREGIERRPMDVAVRNFTNRSPGVCSLGDPTRSSVHQIYSTRQSKTVSKPAQSSVGSTSASCQRLSVVDSQYKNTRKDFHSRANDFRYDRCVRQRLGSSNRRWSSTGEMDRRARCLAHKQKGIAHRIPSSKEVSEDCSRTINHDSIRQQNGSFVPKESGRNPICTDVRRNQKDFATSGELGSNRSFLLPSGSLQYHSRLLVEGKESSRLARARRGHDKSILKVGCPTDRLIRNGSIESSLDVCFDRSMGRASDIHQRIQPSLALQAGMDFSTSAPDTQSTTTPQPGLRNVPADGSTLGNSLLEERLETKGARSPISNTQCQQISGRLIHQSPSAERRRPLFRGLEDTGWAELIDDMDPGDIDLVQSAWRDSTWRTYESTWKQWVSWCRQNGRSPSSPRPQDVAAYLGYLSRVRKLAASTILVHKSVVVTLADPTQKKGLATHPLVSSIVKAIGIKKCASSSSKSQIWDIQDMLRWLRSHCPTEDSIFQVSRHVALLLLLASGRRIHDLTLLCIDDQHCDRSSSSITFWPKFGSKTDNIRNRQSGWQLSCSGDPELSLVKWVNCLINLSAIRRGARPNLFNLFITTRGEVKAATRAIIAGWIKAPFQDLGINYSPGSIRSAVASNDYQNNVPLDFILKRGNWRGSDNFFKHYCKSIERPTNKNVNILNDSFSAI